MLLTAKTLPRYLLEVGLIDRGCVLNNDLMIVGAARRSRNFKVRCGDGGLFVKQIGSWTSQSMELMAREATCYSLARDDRCFPGLDRLAPKLIHYDRARHVLVVALLPDAENLAERHVRLGSFPVEVATMVGRTLGAYHRHKSSPNSSEQDLALFPRTLPWILTINELPDQHQSAAATQLMQMVRYETGFGGMIAALRDGWRTEDLMHGDMKWDNCVLSKGGEHMCVVDWELADFGDARWDVGGIFQSYLSFWAATLRGSPGDSAERIATSGPYSLDGMQPAIRAFWDSYAKEAALEGEERREWLQRSLRYAAARMVQTAYEYAVASTSLTAEAVRLLQISFNILDRPRDAMRDLLGFADA